MGSNRNRIRLVHTILSGACEHILLGKMPPGFRVPSVPSGSLKYVPTFEAATAIACVSTYVSYTMGRCVFPNFLDELLSWSGCFSLLESELRSMVDQQGSLGSSRLVYLVIRTSSGA